MALKALFDGTAERKYDFGLSFIMPCFNPGHYPPEYTEHAIDSILGQSTENFPCELLVYEDGSASAETAGMLDRLEAREDFRVIVFRDAENRGQTFARNYLLTRASYRYTLPCDADDLLCSDGQSPNVIGEMVDVLENNPNVVMAYPQAHYFGTRSGPFVLPPFNIVECLQTNTFPFVHGMYRREEALAAGGYPQMGERQKAKWEDWAFWIRLFDYHLRHGHGDTVEVWGVPRVGYLYRQMDNGNNVHARPTYSDLELLEMVVRMAPGIYQHYRERLPAQSPAHGILDAIEREDGVRPPAELRRPQVL